MIRIFCDKKEKDLYNFWNHMVFHPTNAIEDDWGQMHLDKLASEHAVQMVRIYSLFEESVTLGADGNIKYDFTMNDFRIDSLLKRGLTPYIVYGLLPPFMAAEKDESLLAPRYKNTCFSRSYPSDYSQWEEICRVYTQHLIDRYGEDTVSTWHIHCYNEPDLKHFFYWNAPDWKTRAVEFCKMYKAYVDGVTSVSKKLLIGGPGLALDVHSFDFLRYFLEFVKKNNLRLDFISHHDAYGTSSIGMITGDAPLNALNGAAGTNEVRRIADICGFKDTPLLCDEWGGCTEGYLGSDICPKLVFRENEIYAAYFARMITYFDSVGITDPLVICMSGAHDLETDFGGYRNFFSKSFYPKPIYNAFVLAGKLGEEKMYHWVDLYPRIENGYMGTMMKDISVLPSRHKDGHFSILLSYADDAFERVLRSITADVAFDGLGGTFRVTGWRIDADHANAIRKFNELGKPQNPTEEQKEQIREFGRLKPEDLGTVSPENPVLHLPLENNTTILLELYPEK